MVDDAIVSTNCYMASLVAQLIVLNDCDAVLSCEERIGF